MSRRRYLNEEGFENWWSALLRKKGIRPTNPDLVSALLAWEHQEARIKEMEAELAEKPLRSEADVRLITAMDERIQKLEAELAKATENHTCLWTCKLKAENAALKEAAQAVVESEMDARRQQVTHWQNPTIDALAALLHTGGQP